LYHSDIMTSNLNSGPEAGNTNEQQAGILKRLRLGRMALTAAAIELPAAAVSLVTGDPAYIEGATYLTAVGAGVTLYEAHNHFNNGYTVKTAVSRAFIKL
jgi:hypothetical protein